jgi:NAD(P)-dependent dehydrogenase (short-subunit alcohol dehydrogenase family)
MTEKNSMNAIVVGGGSKFGRYVVDNLRSLDYQVYILSHRDYGTNDPMHLTANFKNTHDVKSQFQKILEQIITLDLFLYVSNFDFGPGKPEHFDVSTLNVEKMWFDTIRVNVVLPHELSLLSLQKTHRDSKIVFMASGLAYEFERDDYTEMAAYAGSKAALNHLMTGLSSYNKEIICALSPHFPDDEDLKTKEYHYAFTRLISLTRADKGKIIKLYLDSPHRPQSH